MATGTPTTSGIKTIDGMEVISATDLNLVITSIDDIVGAAPSTLTTTAKTLVGAINEIDGKVDISDLASSITDVAAGVTIKIAKAVGKIVTICFEYKPTTSGYNTTPLFVMPLGFRPLSHFPLGVGTAASGSDVALPTIGYVNPLGQAIVVHQGTLPSQIKIFGGTYIAK